MSNSEEPKEHAIYYIVGGFVVVFLVAAILIFIFKNKNRVPMASLQSPLIWTQGNQQIKFPKGTDRTSMYMDIQKKFVQLPEVQNLL
jgi:hypothetical protein